MEKISQAKVKIVFVEDYPIYEASVVSILINAGYIRKNIFICRHAEKARNIIREEKPHVAIVDLHIPEKEQHDGKLEIGLGLIRWILDQSNDKTRIVALSRFPERWVVFQVLSAGASFVDKQQYEELGWVLDRVLEGHIIYTSKLAPVIRESFKDAIGFKFEKEDIEILTLIHNQDLTDRQIAEKVGYTEDGVGNRLKEIRKRTGIKERHQLAAWYCQFIAPFQENTFGVADKKR